MTKRQRDRILRLNEKSMDDITKKIKKLYAVADSIHRDVAFAFSWGKVPSDKEITTLLNQIGALETLLDKMFYGCCTTDKLYEVIKWGD